jgi:hypothetical protein
VGGLNNTSAYYQASTKTQIKHNNGTNMEKTKHTKQKQNGRKMQYKIQGQNT